MKLEFLAKFYHGVINIDNKLDFGKTSARLPYFILRY